MSELTDLEICKRIAEIEGFNLTVEGVGCITGSWFKVNKDILHGASHVRGEYNPLTDDGLCFRLMIKHEIRLSSEVGALKWACFSNKIQGCLSRSESPNKAILLAIIEASK